MLKRRNRWASQLAKYNGLGVSIVDSILEDLIYDPGLYKPGQKQPDVTYQPFFTLESDLLALSNWLVLLSSAERNIWNLVPTKRPAIHSKLGNLKEGLRLEGLKSCLGLYGLSCYGPIPFVSEGQTRDLDLLVLDMKPKFGLACELKWLTNSDSMREVASADRELEKGQEQARVSLQWVKSLPHELLRLTGLSGQEAGCYQFQAAVLSENTIGSGWIHNRKIPIISERLLQWVLGEPHKKSLRILWQVGQQQRYLPQREKHFTVDDVRQLEFGGISFLMEEIAIQPLYPWEPAKDIDFTGLV